MVSFWPWRSDGTSPASFEKALSSLSAKITTNTSTLDSLRQNSRRYKGLWTLYSVFAYLLCLVVLAFIVGWKNWGVVEIYIVRLGLATYYEYRTSRLQDYVDGLVKEREKKIDQLKAATKYNTTQQLLEKYGGTPPKKSTPRKPSSNQANNNTPWQGPTTFVPPPTANIPGRNLQQSLPNTPQRQPPLPAQNLPFSAGNTPPQWQQQQQPPHLSPTAEFAPNAFSSAPQYAPSDSGPKWYDRIMDVLLGEDETSPKNRLALICKNCRLVNGQAPPGVKTLEDVGRWRCSGCGTMNGEESEVKRLVKEMKQQEVTGSGLSREERLEPDMKENVKEIEQSGAGEEGSESDITQYSEDEKPPERLDKGTEAQAAENEMVEVKEEPEPEVPARTTRSRAKGRTKKPKT